MTDTDHTLAIAEAGRKWVAKFGPLERKLGRSRSSNDPTTAALIAAVEAEEKAKEPQLLRCGEAYELAEKGARELGSSDDRLSIRGIAAILLEAHKRAAARAEWWLTRLVGEMTHEYAARQVRRALTGQE